MFVGCEDFSGNKKGKEHCASCLYYTNGNDNENENENDNENENENENDNR